VAAAHSLILLARPAGNAEAFGIALHVSDQQAPGLARCTGPENRSRESLAFGHLLTRILVMPETMSLAAVKARFSELVDRVERQQDRVVVTRNGKPAAVLISADDLESLEETLAVMSDRSVAAQIRESQKAVAAGDRGTELDELRAGLQRRRTGGT
jgi:antitoxin YefM